MLMLRNLLNQSEKKGVGSLVSLSGMVPGEIMTFNINNEVPSSNPKKFTIHLLSNRTVIELRLAIARKIQVNWENVKLVRMNLFNQNRELYDTDNGKTLAEVRLRQGEPI